MKQKSSTAASKPGQVLLRKIDTQETQPFEPDHAERLLKYPGTRWEEIDAAAPKGEPDPTGHPDAI